MTICLAGTETIVLTTWKRRKLHKYNFQNYLNHIAFADLFTPIDTKE
jgi:hypothetical protein